MVVPHDPTQKKLHVAKCDIELPEENQTRWFLRVPTVREQRHLDNRTSCWTTDGDGEARLETRDGDAIYWRLKFGLCKPENFATEWVEEANLADPGGPLLVTDSFLSTIPKEVREELSLVARKLALIPEPAEENSSPPPTSPSDGPDASVGGAGNEEDQLKTE